MDPNVCRMNSSRGGGSAMAEFRPPDSSGMSSELSIGQFDTKPSPKLFIRKSEKKDSTKKGLAKDSPPWKAGTWHTMRGYGYVVTRKGEVYYQSHSPWAILKTTTRESCSYRNPKALKENSNPTDTALEEIEKTIEDSNKTFVELYSLKHKKSFHGYVIESRSRIVWDDGDVWTINDSTKSGKMIWQLERSLKIDKDRMTHRGSMPVSNRKLSSRKVNLRSLSAVGIPPGTVVAVRSLNGETRGIVMGIQSNGKYRIQIYDGQYTRLFTVARENLVVAPIQALGQSRTHTTISQVENKHYTHAFVRVITHTTGLGITHSGVLVETKFEDKPIAQTVLDLIEYNKKPYVAIRHYMKPLHYDTWLDKERMLKAHRQGPYDTGKKPWTQTKLEGKPVTYRVWEARNETTEKVAKEVCYEITREKKRLYYEFSIEESINSALIPGHRIMRNGYQK
mmetsp:Transcript_22359/g.33311  ORF Transcript_22359/g.33311 Transcript_22359/m.33311 type:complete len:451 (-) Transcript_22359:319-1671(-)